MARKFGSPSLSRLGVSRDLEIENNATITGLGLGLVAEMNLVELGLVAEMNLVEHGQVADICCRGTRIGSEYVVVVYGNSDDDDAVVIYGSGDVTTCEQNLKL